MKSEANSGIDEQRHQQREGNIAPPPEFVFSKLSFALQQPVEKNESKVRKRNKFKGRDYRRLLLKATHREEKLANMREQNPQKATAVQNTIAWERAFRRAEGQKVKDNIELLKKGLKRKEKTKQKSRKQWAERKGAEEHRRNLKQQKRNQNIEKRKTNTKKKRK